MKSNERSVGTAETRPTDEVLLSLHGVLKTFESVAAVLGVPETQLYAILNDDTPSDPRVEGRLRLTESIAKKVSDNTEPWISKNWLIACNPSLNETPPFELIQSLGNGDHDYDYEVFEQLHAAADSFVAWYRLERTADR